MIRFEHVNLVVHNITETQYFIQTAFPNWKIRGSGISVWYGKKRNWVHIGSDDYYITLNDGGEQTNRNLKGHRIGLAHIGFCVDDLDDICLRLQTNGYEIDIIGADHPFRKSLYFVDPAGFQFEFIQYRATAPEDRNMYGGETSEIKIIAK